MHGFWKRLVWVVGTLGLGALAYALMRNEGERVLRAVSRERGGGDEPRPRPRPVAAPAPEAPGRGEEAGPPQCVAVTKSGDRCAREPQPGSAYCWQHA